MGDKKGSVFCEIWIELGMGMGVLRLREGVYGGNVDGMVWGGF